MRVDGSCIQKKSWGFKNIRIRVEVHFIKPWPKGESQVVHCIVLLCVELCCAVSYCILLYGGECFTGN